jgi:hypothetical protein
VRVSTLARLQDGYILAPRCADLLLRRAALGSKRVLVEDVRVGAEGHLGGVAGLPGDLHDAQALVDEQ